MPIQRDMKDAAETSADGQSEFQRAMQSVIYSKV
jgi:hypothetical protein